MCDWEGLQRHTLCYRTQALCDFSFPIFQCDCIGGPGAGAFWVTGRLELWRDACMSLNAVRPVKEAVGENSGLSKLR